MKKTVKILLFTAMLCICAAGTVACGNRNDDSSSISSSGTEKRRQFRVLSDLEFYNWDDAKDIVIGYENAEVSDVKIEGSSLSASDYTAENGKLTISRNKLDSYSEGKYELKVSSRNGFRYGGAVCRKSDSRRQSLRPPSDRCGERRCFLFCGGGRRSFSDMQRNRCSIRFIRI